MSRLKRHASNPSSHSLEEGSRIFAYVDCLEPSLCSDFRGRCIRILSLNLNSRHQILFPVYYFRVEQKVISVIHVELKDKYSEYCDFFPSAEGTCLVLHFRKIE